MAGSLAAAYFDPAEIFWAELGAALECIDAGSTTVVDHAHFHYTPEHGTLMPFHIMCADNE